MLGEESMHSKIKLHSKKTLGLICLLSFAVQANSLKAQQRLRSTVQLPTFRVFGVNTTVWVPVGGQTHLGSVKRYASGSTSRGVPILGNIPGAGRLFNNRAIGSESSIASSSVQVQVHDFDAMDKALLAEARKPKNKYGRDEPAETAKKTVPIKNETYVRESATQRFADFITQNMGRSPNS